MSDRNENGPLTEAFYYILLSLYPGPAHGYGIMQVIEQMSSGRVHVGAGTLYTALNSLLGKKWIENAPTPESTDARRKMYAITEAGRLAAEAEMNRLEELLRNGRKMTASREGL
ncbi:helix-turn-helix transcriptional regulator [Cohnella lubricantis]|nr:DNA-binding PadR family transcriptional regulator [Cohnella lubricantis]